MPAIHEGTFVQVGLQTLARNVLGDNVVSSVGCPFARMARSYGRRFLTFHQSLRPSNTPSMTA